MSEREIADLKLKVIKQRNYIEYLKEVIRRQKHDIKELSILLDKKIKFRNEVKKVKNER